MKKLYFLILILFQFTVGYSQNSWTKKSNLPSARRYAASSCVINDKAFIGLGNNGTTTFMDWWEYNPTSDSWTQKANFGGGSRYVATCMAIDDQAYAGLGVSGSLQIVKDWWNYDPLSNNWIQKNDFPSTARYGMATFVIGEKGYVCYGNEGTAFGPYTSELWQYDPATDSWDSKTHVPSDPRYGSIGFTINGKGYAGVGGIKKQNGNYFFYKDFYEYDPVSDSWTQRADHPKKTSYPVAFVLNQKGYVGVGNANGLTDPKIYIYDPLTDTWQFATFFPGGGRFVATGFNVGEKGYVGLGSTLSLDNFHKDLWEYAPLAKLSTESTKANVEDCSMAFSMDNHQLFPHIYEEGIYQFVLYDIDRREVQSEMISDESPIDLDISLPKGIYFAELRSEDHASVCLQKVIIQ